MTVASKMEPRQVPGWDGRRGRLDDVGGSSAGARTCSLSTLRTCSTRSLLPGRETLPRHSFAPMLSHVYFLVKNVDVIVGISL